MNSRQYAIVVSFLISLLAVALVPLSGQQGSSYNPWLDYNDDGIINVEDLHALGSAYGTSGTPLNMPMALAYDSGWIDISDKRGQYFSVTPGFSFETTMWTPSVRGKVAADALPHQKYWYGYDMPGWNQTYGGSFNDYGRSAVQTSDGGFAIAGETGSFGSGWQVYFAKTDALGDIVWQQNYGGSNDDYGHCVVQTVDGGYAIAGYSNSFTPSVQVYLVKTDASGNMVWNKTYGGTGDDRAFSLVQTNDGGYAITGYTTSYGVGTPYANVYLIKTDASGNMVWQQNYGGTSGDIGMSVIQTADGGYAVAGYTDSFGSSTQAYLVKTTALGAMVWQQNYGGSNYDLSCSVVRTVDGGFAIAGWTMSFGGGTPTYSNVYLVKTDASGNMVWQQTYGGASGDYAYSIVQTSDGGYALAGDTGSFGAYSQVYLVKTDAQGNMVWQQTYGGGRDEFGESVAQTVDGGFAIAGWTESFGAGTPLSNMYLVKTDALGQLYLQWGTTITDYTADTITLYRGTVDPYYNYIRVRIWVVKESP